MRRFGKRLGSSAGVSVDNTIPEMALAFEGFSFL